MKVINILAKNRNYIILFSAVAIISFMLTWQWLNMPKQESYSVNNGILSYSNRPPVKYAQELWNETPEKVIYRISFKSHANATVYALLSIPKKDGPLPAFFILPGATVTKEGEQSSLGNALNELGYATLTLDQRGHGETGGIIPPFDMDFNYWKNGYESVQHMFVYDALRAFDILYQLPGIDKNRIYAAGESMGGNYAIISAAIEPRISGLLLISSSGFRFNPSPDPVAAEYLKSIAGDSYISMVSPRPLLMLHSEGDKVVPLEHAMDTFNKAGEPKEFLSINSTTHSYTPEMWDILKEGLAGW